MITSDASEVRFWSDPQAHRSEPLAPKQCAFRSAPVGTFQAAMSQLCCELTATIEAPPPNVCQFYTKCVGALFFYRSQTAGAMQLMTTMQPRKLDESTGKHDESNWRPMHGCVQGKVNTERRNRSVASECFCEALLREVHEELGVDILQVVAQLKSTSVSAPEQEIIQPITVNTAWESAYFAFMCCPELITEMQSAHGKLLASSHVYLSWPDYERAKQLYWKSRSMNQIKPVFAEVQKLSSIPWTSFQRYFGRFPSLTDFQKEDIPRAVDGIDEAGQPCYKLFVEALIKLSPRIEPWLQSH
jgi:8-oxo-dGTP pyrophosphatase MutT (NUDIX family)